MNLENNPRIAAVQTRARRWTTQGNYRGAEACLLAELRSANIQPAGRILLWNELGMIYKYLGKFREARHLYRRALQKAQQCVNAKARDFFLADLYHNLGGLDHAQGHFRRGERFARKGLRLRRRVASEYSLPVAVDIAALSALLSGQKKFAEAEKLYQRALRIYRREYGLAHGETAILVSNLAALYQSTKLFRRAQDCYRSALKIKRKAFGVGHPSVAVTLSNLGTLELDRGDIRRAKGHFREALQMLHRSVGLHHFQTQVVKRNYQFALQTVPSR